MPPTNDDPGTGLAERVEQCYRQLPTSLAVNILNCLILSCVLWGWVDSLAILVWLCCVILVTASRYALERAYRRADDPEAGGSQRWARYFTIGALASGIVWGSAGFALFHPQSLPHQVFLAFMIGGMVAGALPVLSAVKGAFISFAFPALTPLTAQMLLQGDQIHVLMGLMGLVFGVAMLSSSRQIHRVFTESSHLRDRLSASIETGDHFAKMANFDALTRIANRRLFDESLTSEWRKAAESQTPLSLLLADIDYFKAYNDTYGHQAGDRCLIHATEAMASVLRHPSYLAARVGGEEFAFLLPDTPAENAEWIAESIRQAVAGQRIEHEGSRIAEHLTVSVGVATAFPGMRSDSSALLETADRALYQAKRQGRDRVVTSPTLRHSNADGCGSSETTAYNQETKA